MSHGDSTLKRAEELKASGRDANQIAGALAKEDPEARNYGIGVLLKDGRGLPTSPTVLKHIEMHLSDCSEGSYRNSAKNFAEAKASVLSWLRVPKEHWDNIRIVFPSDSGTGAVDTAIRVSCMMNEVEERLMVEPLGWAAYKKLAKANGLVHAESEFPSKGALHLYQLGPKNTTGLTRGQDDWRMRAKRSKEFGIPPVLDRAYPGFASAHLLLSGSSFEDVMQSDHAMLKPFFDEGAPFLMAVGPTKALVTFAVRPCGMLIAYSPSKGQLSAMGTCMNEAMRARGSAFEHVVSTAFISAIIHDSASLEDEHSRNLEVVARAEDAWRRLTVKTRLKTLFDESHGGMFRNFPVTDEAARLLYNEHIYPVFTEVDGVPHCRINITGLTDASEADVSLFASLVR